MDSCDVVVIGAGITGCATAWALAGEGLRIVVVDRFGPAAMGSGWTLAGIRQSGRDPAELPLAIAATKVWETLHEELGAPTHYTRSGNLRLARDETEYAQIRSMVADQAARGLELTFLPDNDAVRAVAPAISPEIHGASFCPSDGHADPHATIAAYVEALKRRGVTFAMPEAVEAIEVGAGRVTGVKTDRRRIAAGRVVLATGLLGNDLLAPLDLAIPLDQPMVAVIRTVPIPHVLDQVLGVARGDWAGRQELGGRMCMTSGMQPWSGWIEVEERPEGPRPRVRPPLQSLNAVITRAGELLPGIVTAPVEDVWAGVVDMTPDSLPVLSRAPGIDGLVIGIGFSGHGFGIGPVTGQLLADLVLDRTPAHPLDAFAHDRFSGNDDWTRAPVMLHG